jgi:hypothetical protein
VNALAVPGGSLAFPAAPCYRPPVRRLVLLPLLLSAACATAPAVRPAPPPIPAVDGAPARALLAFLDAVDAGRFDEAYRLLSGRWRATLTPERLRDDLAEGGALARDRLARARLAASGPAVREGDRARFPIADGRAVRLVLEESGWKVDDLE